MSKRFPSDIVIRDKRQVTLPRNICEQLGLEKGDRLSLYIEDNRLVALPQKSVALDALRELRQIFAESGISEQDLITSSRRIRRELAEKHYGSKA